MGSILILFFSLPLIILGQDSLFNKNDAIRDHTRPCDYLRKLYKSFSHLFDLPTLVDTLEYMKNRDAIYIGLGKIRLFNQ